MAQSITPGPGRAFSLQGRLSAWGLNQLPWKDRFRISCMAIAWAVMTMARTQDTACWRSVHKGGHRGSCRAA